MTASTKIPSRLMEPRLVRSSMNPLQSPTPTAHPISGSSGSSGRTYRSSTRIRSRPSARPSISPGQNKSSIRCAAYRPCLKTCSTRRWPGALLEQRSPPLHHAIRGQPIAPHLWCHRVPRSPAPRGDRLTRERLRIESPLPARNGAELTAHRRGAVNGALAGHFLAVRIWNSGFLGSRNTAT